MYGTVRSNILSMETLPNINRAYSMIIQEERHQNMAKTHEEKGDVVGFSVQSSSPARAAFARGKEKQGTCTHSGRPGHEVKSCYQIIGYPEWWGDRPRGNDKGIGRGKVSGRGRGNGARANVTRATNEGGAGA